jgi:hypothetical protein
VDEGAALELAMAKLQMDGKPLDIGAVMSLVGEATQKKVVKEDAASEAILGTVEGGKKGGRIKIRHVCRVRVELLRQKELTWHYLDGERNLRGKSEFDEKYVVPGNWLDESQKWCVL